MSQIDLTVQLDADEDFDIWDYLRSFSDTDRSIAIKAAIRDQMQSQNFETQVFDKLTALEQQVAQIGQSLANLRAYAVQTATVRGEFPEAEANVDSLIDF